MRVIQLLIFILLLKMYSPTVLLRLSASADHLARAEDESRCPRLPEHLFHVWLWKLSTHLILMMTAANRFGLYSAFLACRAIFFRSSFTPMLTVLYEFVKSSWGLTKPDDVLELWDNFWRCSRLVGCWWWWGWWSNWCIHWPVRIDNF